MQIISTEIVSTEDNLQLAWNVISCGDNLYEMPKPV